MRISIKVIKLKSGSISVIAYGLFWGVNMELIVSFKDDCKVHTISINTKHVPRNLKEINRLEKKIKRINKSNIVKILEYSLGNPEIRLDKIIKRTSRRLRGVVNE